MTEMGRSRRPVRRRRELDARLRARARVHALARAGADHHPRTVDMVTTLERRFERRPRNLFTSDAEGGGPHPARKDPLPGPQRSEPP